MAEEAVKRPHADRWTVDDLDALPYDEWHRYELIDGELIVSTAPHAEHQSVCSQVVGAFVVWNREARLGRVFIGPGVVFTENDAVIPDVVWVSHERAARILDERGKLRGAPELVVEVLSPGAENTRRDRTLKMRLYATYGVEEYWLVDWRAHTVEVYRRVQSGARRATRLRPVATLGVADTLTSPLLPGFTLRVAQLFEPA